MKAKIAVATVSGRAYYLIVSELKKKNTPFLSVMPDDPLPIEIKTVITTEDEQHLVKHERILVYRDGADPESLINEALQIARGKSCYERIVVGVDPGEVFGLAVLADGNVVETANCFSVEETALKIQRVLKCLQLHSSGYVTIKIGDGVPKYKERLLRTLDNALPQNVMLESVSEAGTDRYISENKHRRGLRDIVSATRIAGRNGHVFPRGRPLEKNH